MPCMIDDESDEGSAAGGRTVNRGTRHKENREVVKTLRT